MVRLNFITKCEGEFTECFAARHGEYFKGKKYIKNSYENKEKSASSKQKIFIVFQKQILLLLYSLIFMIFINGAAKCNVCNVCNICNA